MAQNSLYCNDYFDDQYRSERLEDLKFIRSVVRQKFIYVASVGFPLIYIKPEYTMPIGFE